MSKVWKWIIGIVAVLVVVGVVVGGAWVVRNRLFKMERVFLANPPSQQAPEGRVPGPFFGQRDGLRGMMPYGGRMFHMMGRGGFGMDRMGFGGLVGGLFMLGLLALIGVGIAALVRGANRPVGTVAAVAAPVAVTPPPAMVHACKKCGQSVQDGVNFCPNCGKKQ
jgi:hypothetical protein